MISLKNNVSDIRYDKDTQFYLNWDAVKGKPIYSDIAPCVKRYLFNYVRSNIIELDSNDWNKAVMLPTARFVKDTPGNIWNNSRKKSLEIRRNNIRI